MRHKKLKKFMVGLFNYGPTIEPEHIDRVIKITSCKYLYSVKYGRQPNKKELEDFYRKRHEI